MTLSIAAITGSTAASPTRTSAVASDFALSLAQAAGAPVTGKEDDPPPSGDPAAKDDADSRQDDAADGNPLPPAAPTSPDPSLLAAWLMPMPVTAEPMPVATGATGAMSTVIPTAATTNAAPIPPLPSLAVALPADAGAASAVPVPAASPAAAATLHAAPARAAGPAIAASTASFAPAPVAPAALLPTGLGIPVQAPAAPLAVLPTSVAFAASVQPGAPQTPLPTAPSTIVALAGPVSPIGVTVTAVQPPSTADTPVPSEPAPTASALGIDPRAAPVVALAPAQSPVAPQPGGPVATTTTSAIQAFGTAMRAGFAKEPRAEPIDASAALTGTTHAVATPAVAATGDAQQAPLDLRRENWPHAMIDRIEALRDAADATSTKMRVVPDALGPIEMSVRKDGDTVHVHFTADQAQTRALLTDAQPRLAAIAEQRGLRLGGSTVDAGNGGTGQQHQQPATARPPVAPPSSTVAAETAADDDTRVA